MSLNKEQLQELIIDPAITSIGLYSPEASSLLLATAMAESNLTYLKQVGGGPALGLWQMEPATHDDIWRNFLLYRPELEDDVRLFVMEDNEIDVPRADQMIGNLWYAAAMARVHYLRVPESLPEAGDLNAQAMYWKAYYNTPEGRGTLDHFKLMNV